jgi:hypothetical protein
MVTLRRAAGELRLTVADNGSGSGLGGRLVEAREQTTDRFWSYLPTMYIHAIDLVCILYHYVSNGKRFNPVRQS